MSLMPTRTKNVTPKVGFVSVTEWQRGRQTRFDIDRMPVDALRVTENVQLDQNGTITPRPGLRLYYSPVGTVMGQVYEYVYMDTTKAPNVPVTRLIWLENRSGTGYVCTNQDGGTATQISGKTYSVSAKAHFEQIYGKVLVMNGIDYLSYMDIQTQTITPFNALATPGAPTATATGISGTTYSLRYRVTAANQGETAGSTAAVVGVSQQRDTWNGTSQYVQLTGTIPAGAGRINIYCGDSAGNEWFLDSIAANGTTFTYTDTGSIALNTNRVCPVGDSTAGPRTTRARNIKGQVFMVGDTDNPGRIWFGGYGNSALDFSSFNGGGWVEPNKGGKDLPVNVVPFRDGKGTPMAACLSKGTNGTGKRYLLQPTTTTLGTTTINYMSVLEDSGADGTDSPDGILFLDDALWYPSRQGFKSTNTKPQIQNILSTTQTSDNISTDVNTLSSKYMDACVGLAYDRKLFWALPNQSTTNNQIWILDLRQNGSWYFPWYVNADWLWLYADNTTGMTYMMALVNNKFMVFDYSYATNDNGVTFQTNSGSGGIKFSNDGEIWGNVIDVTFVFNRPQGNINLSASAYTEDGIVTYTDVMNSAAKQSPPGWGQYGWGVNNWGNTESYPLAVSTSTARKTWTVAVDEECNLLTWGVSSTEAGVQYQLAEVVVRYANIGFKEVDN